MERIVETNGFGFPVVPVTLSWDDLVSEATVAQNMAAGSGSGCGAALSTSNGSCSCSQVHGGPVVLSSLGTL